MMTNHISIEPSPFLPQTTIAIEKVKIAAKAAQPIWKIINNLISKLNITELPKKFLIQSNFKQKFISQKKYSIK